MRNRRKNKKITLLLLILLGVSIGFAALATTLKINGTANISKNTWNVYWDNVANQAGVTTTEPEIGADTGDPVKTKVTWTVDLNTPGDFYEFTVDAVNAGTIDAEITDIIHKLNGEEISATNKLPDYIKYSVTYADDDIEPTNGDLLAKRVDATHFTTKTYKIRVEYDKDAVSISDVNDMDDEGVRYELSFEVKYGQATPSEESRIAARIAEIEANPENYRNPEQSAINPDIGIDEDGNVINLDLWTLKYDWSDEPFKCYEVRSVYNEELGETEEFNEIYLHGTSASGPFAMATASENIVNGELQTPIPAYIMLGDVGEFYPVTEIMDLFGRHYDDGWDEPISKYPNIPSTVTRIGELTFAGIEAFETLEIPKQIEYIGRNAFGGAFTQEGENNRLTFEEGSKLKEIGENAFFENNLKSPLVFPSTLQKIDKWAFNQNALSGDLVLPDSVTYIGYDAFTQNNLTSVSFPTSAEYFTNYRDEYGGLHNTFDDGVTITRR